MVPNVVGYLKKASIYDVIGIGKRMIQIKVACNPFKSNSISASSDQRSATTPHTITPAVGAVCRCKAKAGLRRSPRGLHTRTRLSSLPRLTLDSSLKTTWFHSDAVQLSRAWLHSKRRRRWVGVKGRTRNGRRDPKYPSARRLRMVQENTGAPSEGAICAWMVADEAVDCTRAFLPMWQSSRRMVCRGGPEPGFRVNDISQIHWSQHLLTTKSERPN
ncbi:uncharacterized protein TNCV_5049091 [Trichonephila clavipes]|nr:uncharacterized protein TNCV_5049091 [Trichonephila clavipes]